jgi:ubiquinone/menaquinone biosynthesis C-methylase UbiE
MTVKPFNKKHVCPWWLCFTFDNPLRRIFHDPVTILGSYVRRGDTAVDIGPGMGFFTIPLAKLVGPAGKVIAVDIQPRMLSALAARAQKHGVAAIIRTHLAEPDSLALREKADFILAFWMAHEVPDLKKFFSEIRKLMKPQGWFFLVEPLAHVSRKDFLQTIDLAKQSGLLMKECPKIRMSQSALFTPDKIERHEQPL